ncbi:MarR family winged helix-turn-helix transcriptional regulator [Nocardioides astragali]|uniref:MarR family winged helix-turn-helix transcriptional regulator n=1 Tax=Nocardioides astragali TaxID=1776736 RepID=A0ABW2N8M4_9ACTN
MVRQRSTSVKGLTPADVRDEDVDVTFMVWLTSRATTDLVDSVLAPAGLDGDEFAIYSVLTAAPSITPTELARWMAAPPTTVSSYVKRFEARGHVEREPNPDDGRSYRIKLTPAGRRAHRAAAKLFIPMRTRVEEGLGPRGSEVREALLTLRSVLDEIRHTPPGALE